MSEVLNFENYTFKVQGLHCVKCIRQVQSVANQFDEIKRVDVDLGDQVVATRVSANFRLELFISELKKLGFGVLSFHIEAPKSELKKVYRTGLMKIGVAGACCGNIMILAVAEYSGAKIAGWPYIFKFFSLLLFLPVIFYAATPLYSGAWHALKAKKLSIDAPIVLAIIGGFVLSVIGLTQSSQAEVYFDSLSMFVFFLLASRFLVYRIQAKYTASISIEDIYGQARALVVGTDGVERSVDSKEVRVGDVLSIPKSHYVCFDGKIQSKLAVISDAFFTGEAFPKEKVVHDPIFAGSKNVGSQFLMTVTQTADNSRLAQIVDLLNKSLKAPTPISTLADEGSKLLTSVIFASSGLILLYFGWQGGDLYEGVNRALALLVVACPCGLAIATPLVQTLAVRKAMERSLLVKQVSSLETINDIDAVFFDKTGTLTQGEMSISQCVPRRPTLEEKKIILSLESESEHPVAEALRHYVGPQEKIPVVNLREELGQGVSGEYKGTSFSLKVESGAQRRIVFMRESESLLSFLISDQVDTGATKLISHFRSRGIPTFILSGDKKNETLKIAAKLGIDEQKSFFEMSPSDKAEFIKNYDGNTLYFGDGINDSLAMSYADVSVSVQSAADVAFKSSKIHILEGGVSRFLDLLELAKNSIYSIKVIIALSLLYNFIFAVLAAMGWIQPLVAVLIMPASSLTITWLGLWLMNRRPLFFQGQNQ